MFRPFDNTTLTAWRDSACTLAGGPDQTLTELINQLRLEGTPKPSAPINVFLGKYAVVAASLLAEPTYFPDVGAALRDDLTIKPGARGWSQTYVSAPEFGFPRPYYSMTAAYPGTHAPFALPGWDRPGTIQPPSDEDGDGADFRAVCAQLVMLMDRPFMTDALVPEAKSIVKRDNREPFWGQSKAALLQAERLTAVGLLYERQADAFVLRMNQSLWDLCYKLATALYPKELPILEQYDKIRKTLLDRIPCHPLLESIANLYSNVSLSTYYGVKQAAIRHGTSDEWEVVEKGNRSVPSQLMVLHAMSEYARLKAIVKGGSSWPLDWAIDVAPSLDRESARAAVAGAPGQQSMSSCLEWLATFERYVSHWPEIARTLNWSGAIGPQAIGVETAGADFVLCDGDAYTDMPTSVLAGLRPNLSMGNVQVAGFARRSGTSFGTGPNPDTDPSIGNGGVTSPVAFKWSACVARGHVTALDRKETFARFFMPPGMLMGEADVETRFAGGPVTDPIGLAVIAFYRDKSPQGYVSHWYTAPTNSTSRQTPEGLYMHTEWGAVSESRQSGAAQALLLTGYGEVNVDKQPLNAFVFRDHFNMRFPVQMARDNEFEWYDELGGLKDLIPFDGHVNFDDVVTLTNDAGAVDQFIDLLKVHQPTLDTPATDEVRPPEQVNT
jgi:hypothetical protein